MNVFYEEDGAFKAAAVLADQGGALQVEASSGKRSKVKANQILIRFDGLDAAQLLSEAGRLAADIDLDFLWACAPKEEFGFAELAREYFGAQSVARDEAALLIRIHAAPMYFYRRGKGRYKAAPEDALKAALAGAERRRKQALQKDEFVELLKQGRLPDEMRQRVDQLLFRPDKNSIEFKALDEASHALSLTPSRLMLQVGGLSSPRELHERRFLSQYFPHGVKNVSHPLATRVSELPLAAVKAFSIDDHTTTEIDDAFSVTVLDHGFRIGIHIAAPGLAITRGDANDVAARERYSTVYTPGQKITMLSEALIEAFSLFEGTAKAALSLYLTIDPDGSIVGSESKVERVPIAHNLRLNQWDDVVTEEMLGQEHVRGSIEADMAVLWRLVTRLHQARQDARVAAGLKPEMRNRPDYSFYIEGEEVNIVERRRDAPLDRLVAELMILANSTWGALLAEHQMVGIYRGQQGFGPSGRVRMVAHPMPHQGLGVAQYAWSTSPLRRYVDLFNQWQIMAAIGVLPLTFQKNDAEVFAIISGFETAYAAYAEYQTQMERYWCLRWLQPRQGATLEARLQREDSALLNDIPLQLRIAPLANLARGTHLEVSVLAIDEVDLTAQTQVLAIIEEVDESELMDDEEPFDVPVDGAASAAVPT